MFEEANKGANNVGIVVNPVRLAKLGEFGSPQFVADKLIQAEKRKVIVFPIFVGIWFCMWITSTTLIIQCGVGM